MERMGYISMTNKANGHVGFHYLMTEIQLCTLILLELNILNKIMNMNKNYYNA